MKKVQQTLMAVALIVGASAALAADGAREINAACVDTGCFTNDTAGFPVNLSEPGSYVLTSDLVVSDSATSGLSANADDIHIDLNGFNVRGPVTCNGTPVTSCSSSSGGNGVFLGERSSLVNGSVTGFGGYGVRTGRDSEIRNLAVSNNGAGGVSPYYSIVRDSVVSRNGGHGVVSTSGGGNARIIGSQMRGNAHRGVNLSSGMVINSSLINNGTEGLGSTTGGGNAGYAHNILFGNNAGGAQISGGVIMGCNVVNSLNSCP